MTPRTPSHRVRLPPAAPRTPRVHPPTPGASSRRCWARQLYLRRSGIGTAALLRSPGPTRSAVTSAHTITVGPTVPLSGRELAALVDRSPDFGPLADPKRRAACLSGLGYPGSVQVLGAEPLHVDGRPAIVLVLPGERPGDLVALAVAPSCSAVDTGLIADTTVRRP